jgi:hypothetical protein
MDRVRRANNIVEAGNGGRCGKLFQGERGTEATVPKFTIVHLELGRLPQWLKTCIPAGTRPPCLSEVEREEERCLEAMLHWRDPARPLESHRRSHTRVDDNPASG